MDVFKKVEKPFLKYRKNNAPLEFECRLGKAAKGFFDTNIPKDQWMKVLSALRAYQGWESVNETSSTVFSKDDWRVITDHKTSDQTIQKKRKLQHWDFTGNGKLDFRIAMAQETPYDELPDDVTMETMRTRERTSFVRKNLSIDMTKIIGQGEDLDDEDDEHFQIELEIVDASKVGDDTQLKNILAKIECVMKLL